MSVERSTEDCTGHSPQTALNPSDSAPRPKSRALNIAVTPVGRHESWCGAAVAGARTALIEAGLRPRGPVRRIIPALFVAAVNCSSAAPAYLVGRPASTLASRSPRTQPTLSRRSSAGRSLPRQTTPATEGALPGSSRRTADRTLRPGPAGDAPFSYPSSGSSCQRTTSLPASTRTQASQRFDSSMKTPTGWTRT